MQAYFAAGMLTSAAEAVNIERSYGNLDFSNLYSNTFSLFYPTYDHPEEESTEEEPIIYKPYKHNSCNPFTSSDSENNCSSDSNDWSGPSYSSRSGDSAYYYGSDSHKYSYIGDSASDYPPYDYHSDHDDHYYGHDDHYYGSYYSAPVYDGPLYSDLYPSQYSYYTQPVKPQATHFDPWARCARVDFTSILGIEGTMDFYVPTEGPALVDGSFKNLLGSSRYGVAIHRLAPRGDIICNPDRLGT